MPEKPPQIDTQAVMQGGIDINNSTLFIEGEIGVGTASYLARALHLFRLQKQPITIYLNTVGGHVDAAFGMYDLIRACPQHVTIIGYGEIASAGVLILQAGDVRLLTKNCSVMVHPGSGGTGECLPLNVKSNAKAIEDTVNKFYTTIGRSMGLTAKEMLARYTWDTYLTARQAVKCGLSDGIV